MPALNILRHAFSLSSLYCNNPVDAVVIPIVMVMGVLLALDPFPPCLDYSRVHGLW